MSGPAGFGGAVTLLKDVVAVLPDASFVVSADARLICANPSAFQLFPALRDGDSILRAVRAPDILDAIRSAKTEAVRTIVWLDRVPVERQFDVHVASLGARLSDAILVSLRDTTEARRVERVRSDFVANASHELRTPLASLLGFVETLQGPARDDAVARVRFLAIMGEQARRMSRLVDDLLSLSRIERSLHVRPDAGVDLVSVAGQMTDALAPMAADGHVSLRLLAPASVYVLGDRDELLRVVENLAENAIKYGGPGTVDIHVEREGDNGVLIVDDSGPGIAPEHIPRLTERFYRIDVADSRAKGGTGLGLAIVKHIVARHRGRLTIASRPSGGTRFKVSIPLSEADGSL